LREKVASLKDLIPIACLIVFIFYGIFTGIMTPTETAALGAGAALAIAAVLGRFSWRLVYDAAISALGVSAMILLIMGSASITAYAMTVSGIPVRLVEWVARSHLSELHVLLIIYLIYLGLGCIMDGISMMMVTLPFVLPILLALKIDLVWFGVVLIVLTEMGMLTPPLGVTLYVALGLDKEAKFEDAVMGILPYLWLQGVVLALLTAFPNLALFLPNLFFGPQ
jgi:tripartite ATP-independent transporter DctM subunit